MAAAVAGGEKCMQQKMFVRQLKDKPSSGNVKKHKANTAL